MKLRAGLVGLFLLFIGAGSRAPRLAITEIMYDPKSAESDDQQTEWVEVQNFGDEAINLKGLQITSGSKTRPHDPKQRFVLGEVTVEPGEYVVIGVGKKECYDDLGLPEMGVYIGEEHYAWFTNDGDSVAIRDKKGKVIDEVVYQIESPWPVVKNSGSSIQFIAPEGEDPREANDQGENWVASNSTNSEAFKDHGRGTPGSGPKKATTQEIAKASATTKPIRARIGKKK